MFFRKAWPNFCEKGAYAACFSLFCEINSSKMFFLCFRCLVYIKMIIFTNKSVYNR